MDQTLSLFVSMAEIGGVFVAFGALIGITRREDAPPERIARIQAAVTIGLVVIVAAMLPVVVSRYDIDEQTLWRVCSLVFLILSWAIIGLAARSRSIRDAARMEARQRPTSSTFFWLVLEVPVQLPLILAVLALPPDLGEAYYATALAFNLFQAAFVLAQLVYDRAPSSGS